MVEISATAAKDESWVRGNSHRLGPLLVLVLSALFLSAALSLEIGSISRPGPGFWPLVVSSLTAVLAVVILFHPRRDEEHFAWTDLRRVLYLLVALLAFPFLFEILGFIIPAILLIIFMMRVLSRESWVRSVLVATITSVVAYVLFAMLLDVRMSAFDLAL